MSDQKYFIPDQDAGKLSVVLIQPDIPQNTGNIARLCRATGSELVLVRPFGFRLTDQGLLRAGMDYWKDLKPIILEDTDEFFEWAENRNVYFLSCHGDCLYTEVEYKAGDALVFGSESSGLPKEVLEWAKKREALVTLPMIKEARCINISSSVAASVYEALRQIYCW